MTSSQKSFLFALLVAGWIAAPLAAEIVRENAPLFTRLDHAVVVPAELRNHVLFVSVVVNGQGPFRVFVDTGCSFTFFSAELAAAVKVRPVVDDDAPVLNAVGDRLTVPRALFDSVELGGVRFEGVLAGVVPLADLSQLDGQRIDGALGFSLFSDVVFGLDYPGRRLLLGPGWPENLPPLRAEMPVREHAEVPFVAAELQGKTFEVEIDTGSNGGLHLPARLAAALSWKTEPRPGRLLEVIDEEVRESLGRLNGQLALGPLLVPEPVAAVGSPAPSIGYDVLGRFCLVFDQRTDRVRFYSQDTGPVASPAERSVGVSIKLDSSGWRIAGIIPGSPAEEAHLAVGDLITRLEGEPACDWSRDRLHDWVDTHDTLALQVARGETSRELTLHVWSLVP